MSILELAFSWFLPSSGMRVSSWNAHSTDYMENVVKLFSPQGGTCYIYIQGCAYVGSNSNPKIWIHRKFCTQKYCDPAYLLPKIWVTILF